MRIAPLLTAASWLLTPLAILYGLRLGEPRHVALLLAALLVVRHRRGATRLLGSLSRLDQAIAGGLVLLAAATALGNSELLLRLYPAAVNLGMLLLFAGSLVSPPSMVERFARLSDPALPAAAVGYTRSVTVLWCGFFVANGALALYTALYASRDDWALYNGGVAYALMGVLFAGEWLYRRFVVLPGTR